MKDFKMDELRILCAIAETASVSRAAQRLNMPQSNVSRTLTSVERKVGLAIFLRTARELVRTEFGEQFIHASSAVLAQHEQLINLADRYKNTPQGVVTLGAPIGIHQFLGRYILPALRKTLPELQINLVTRNASEREQKYGAIFNSDCDLLISPLSHRMKTSSPARLPAFVPASSPPRITSRNTLSPNRRRWWIMSASPCVCWAVATISGPSKAKTANRLISR